MELFFLDLRRGLNHVKGIELGLRIGIDWGSCQ